MSLSVKTIRKSLKLFGASDLQHSRHLLDHLQMLNYHKNKHERKISSRNSPVTVKNHNCFILSIKLCSLAPYPTCIPRGKSLHMQLYLENDKLLREWSLGLSTKKYMYR